MLTATKELFTRPSGGYQISRSVRFRQSASAYFNRTPASASNRTTWTWSGWVKRGVIPTSSANGSALFGAGTFGANAQFRAYLFDAGIGTNTACVYLQETVYGVSNQLVWYSTAVLRDPSAWYHVVIAMDTTQATGTNRIKVYVNGVAITGTFHTTPAQNQALSINNTVGQSTGAAINGSAFEYLDGYITEVNFIDGQQLTPSSFGETDTVTGVWKPKKYMGTYGTNGYYLNFSDNSASTATTIGKDYSGNGNNWTPNNISVTAGATYDSMLDVPTVYGDGDNGRGNYAVLNPLFRNSSLITEGNLHFNKPSIGWATSQATMSLPASKTYFEATAVLVGGANSGVYIGIATASATQDTYQVANQWSFGGSGGVLNLYNQTTLISPAGSSAAGDILQVAYDGATGNLWFGKNNTWYNSTGGTTGNPSTGANPTITLTPGTEVFPCAICYANALKFTFGQRPFTYTPPTGFKALNTQNLPDATIKKGNQYFDATTYTGTSASNAVVNASGFQPDLVWLKNRNYGSGTNHVLVDTVRGASLGLASNLTNADFSTSGNFSSINSNGFTVTGTARDYNFLNDTFVGWQWNAGGSTVTNTSGSITSQVRANPTAGFSIVTYTGTGANATVGHGLGVAPKMIILKPRSIVSSWLVWHTAFTGTEYIVLESTAAKASLAAMWNSTTPTSSVFSIGTNANVNQNAATFVAYCFSEVAGYSTFGSYTGNGSTDGPFVYLGFRPKFVLIKGSSFAANWTIFDSSRDTYNITKNVLRANLSAAEFDGSAQGANSLYVDFTSNGFKLRYSGSDFNSSGQTFIYAAFAENPFKHSLAR